MLTLILKKVQYLIIFLRLPSSRTLLISTRQIENQKIRRPIRVHPVRYYLALSKLIQITLFISRDKFVDKNLCGAARNRLSTLIPYQGA